MRTKNIRVFAEDDDNEIVISGMSGRFPNSRNIADLEYHLFNKVLWILKHILLKMIHHFT